MENFLAMNEDSFRRLIEFVKILTSFKQLPEHDQIMMIKGVLMLH